MNAPKRIHLIELRDPSMGLASQRVNSLMLPILAVWATQSGWEARVSFGEIGDVDEDHPCDVVALGLYSFLAAEGYALAHRLRARGRIVIIGGPHTKGCLDEVLDHADLVFDRCDETSWKATLDAIAAGTIRPGTGRGVFVPSAEMSVVPPYRELRPFYGRHKIPLLLSSLGCPHDCDFCVDWDSTYVKRDVDAVIDDIREIDAPFFIFCDPNFGVNRKFTAELLRRMVPLRKRYMMETSLAWLLHDEYLALLRDSGCIGIEIGLESLTTAYDKNGIKNADALFTEALARLARIKRYIPLIQVNVVLGLDGDTEETFARVAEFYRRADVDALVPFVVTPFPGTPFWERVNREGRLFEREWRHFHCGHLTMTLRNFSPERFYDLYIALHRELHAPGLVVRKVVSHLRHYRDPKLAVVLLAFLVLRTWNGWRHYLPELRRDRLRAMSRAALAAAR